MHTFARLSAILATLLLIAVPSIEARQMRGGGPRGMMSALVDPVEVALENRAELALGAEQVAQLEAYRALSLERTADAREVAAPMIERMRQMRERAGAMQERRREMREQRAEMQERRAEMQKRRGTHGEGAGMRDPRAGMHGEGGAMPEPPGQAPQARRDGTGMDAEMRAAIATLRAEHARSRGELERLLTAEQISRLHALVQPRPMRTMQSKPPARPGAR